MNKRNGGRKRDDKRFNPDDIKVGDTITSDDILGIDRQAVDDLPPPGWLRGDASPIPMDIFDCRAVALTWMSTTKDPDIAESFTRQRRSDGAEYIDTVPEQAVCSDFDLDIDLGGFELKQGPLFKAKQMEDKWDIYHYGELFYFVRSWTGTLVHVAHGREREGVLHVDSIVTSSVLLDGRDRTFFIREVYFLIVNHVLDAMFPHPIPAYLADSDESILAFSFSEFGRRGLYGTLMGAVDIL
jgi:hypothetical protein